MIIMNFMIPDIACSAMWSNYLKCHSMNLYKTFLLQQCKSYYFLYSYILPNFIFSRFQHLTLQNNLIWDVFIGSLISKPKVRNQPENLNSVTERGITCDYMKEMLRYMFWYWWKFCKIRPSNFEWNFVDIKLRKVWEQQNGWDEFFSLIWVPDHRN